MSGVPRVGEIMYGSKNAGMPVRIVHVNGTLVSYVPAEVEVRHTHKGNLYDATGESPYWE